MRCKRLRISPELLLSLFTVGVHPGNRYEVMRDAVPEDAKLVNVRHSWPNGVEILIESASFPDLSESQEIPELVPVMNEDPRKVLGSVQ